MGVPFGSGAFAVGRPRRATGDDLHLAVRPEIDDGALVRKGAGSGRNPRGSLMPSALSPPWCPATNGSRPTRGARTRPELRQLYCAYKDRLVNSIIGMVRDRILLPNAALCSPARYASFRQPL